jgi:hypothetical protein
MPWKKSSRVVQAWGAVQINSGLCSSLDESWGSGQLGDKVTDEGADLILVPNKSCAGCLTGAPQMK